MSLFIFIKFDIKICVLCKFRRCNHRLPIGIGRWQGTERQNRTCNICDKNEIGGVLQCPSHHDDRRRRLLNSTYLTRVNVSKFDNLFQSRNKIKIRHLCKFIKIIFSKTHLSFFVVFLLCYIHPLVMCVQVLILNVCIYLCTIAMHWFMRTQNLES